MLQIICRGILMTIILIACIAHGSITFGQEYDLLKVNERIRFLLEEVEPIDLETCCRGLGKHAEFLERALHEAYRAEIRGGRIDFQTSGYRSFELTKKQMLKALSRTMSYISGTSQSQNRIVALQLVLHYPSSNWEPLLMVRDTDFFIWTLRGLKTLGHVNNNDLLDYVENHKEKHPWLRSSEGVKILQRNLSVQGFPTKIDGIYGEKTISTMQAFQRANNIKKSYSPDDKTLKLLDIDPKDFYFKTVDNEFIELLKEMISDR